MSSTPHSHTRNAGLQGERTSSFHEALDVPLSMEAMGKFLLVRTKHAIDVVKAKVGPSCHVTHTTPNQPFTPLASVLFA